MAKAVAERKQKERVGRDVPCRYCGNTINTLNMGFHIMRECPATPQRLDEGVDDLPPGTLVGIGSGAPMKKAWTRDDFYRAYGTPDKWPLYTPPKSKRIQVLGRVFFMQEGVEGHFPSIAIDVLKQSIENTRNIMQGLDSDVKVIGKGPLVEA